MNFLDMLKNGFQPQPEPVNDLDPYQNQLALQRAADMRNRGVSMQQNPYQGGANPLGLIAGLATMLRGRNLERRGDESITAAMKRQFELDNERAAKEAQKAAEKEKRDFELAIEKARRIAEAEAEARRRFESPKGPVKVGRSLVQVGEDGKPVVLYRDPEAQRQDRPSELEQRIALARQMGANDQQLQSLVLGQAAARESAPAGYRFSETGELVAIPGGPADPDVKLKGQRERAQNEYMKKLTPFNDAEASFNRLSELVTQYGTEQMPFSESKAKLKTAYTNARDNIRALAATGVLNVGELPFLEEKLADPTAWTSLSAKAIQAQLGEINHYLQQKKKGLADAYGVSSGNSQSADDELINKYLTP